MTTYSIPNNRISTHTKHKRQPRQAAPVVAETVIYLERTPELYAQHRNFWLAQSGELDETCPFFAPTAPAAWLAQPPMKVSIKA